MYNLDTEIVEKKNKNKNRHVHMWFGLGSNGMTRE